MMPPACDLNLIPAKLTNECVQERKQRIETWMQDATVSVRSLCREYDHSNPDSSIILKRTASTATPLRWVWRQGGRKCLDVSTALRGASDVEKENFINAERKRAFANYALSVATGELNRLRDFVHETGRTLSI